MNQDNTWIFWVAAAGILFYWFAQSNATTAANLNQTGIPAGSKVSSGTVLNQAGVPIGTVTAQGNYVPNMAVAVGTPA
jgi:hypothetical protein